jgi:LacI family transcriptional regulator
MRDARPNQPSASQERRAASIDDVAHAASVSTATVSRVLNNPALVTPATAARVQKAILELDYRPNLLAKGLSTRRSRVLGIALPDLFGEFYSELLRGADGEARRQGYHLLVSSEARIANGGHEQDHNFTFGLIDGLAVMITEPDESIWSEVRKSTLPVVVLDSDIRAKGVSSIVVDSEGGTSEAMEHLLGSVAPERCYFIGGPERNFDTAERARAFAAALRSRGHEPRPGQSTFGSYTLECGHEWAAANLPRIMESKLPIAVLAANDEIAYGVMQVAHNMGYAIPQDIRLVGFDDSRLASLVRPRLSSVRIPAAEIGAAAIKLLVERISTPTSAVAKLRLGSSLVIRESSKVR